MNLFTAKPYNDLESMQLKNLQLGCHHRCILPEHRLPANQFLTRAHGQRRRLAHGPSHRVRPTDYPTPPPQRPHQLDPDLLHQLQKQLQSSGVDHWWHELLPTVRVVDRHAEPFATGGTARHVRVLRAAQHFVPPTMVPGQPVLQPLLRVARHRAEAHGLWASQIRIAGRHTL